MGVLVLLGLVLGSVAFAQAESLRDQWVIMDLRASGPKKSDPILQRQTTTRHIRTLVENRRLFLVREIPDLQAVVVKITGAPHQAKALQALREDGFTVYPAVPITTTGQTFQTFAMDPFFSNQWHLWNTGQNGGQAGFDIGATHGWSQTTGSATTVLAITDTGVQLNHHDMVGRLWINRGEIPDNGIDDDNNGYIDDVHGWNSALQQPGPLDDPTIAGHGTAVAGTAAATGSNGLGTAGVDWNCQIMPVVIFAPGPVGTDVTAAEGIIYALRAGATVINASWGSREYSPLFEAAVQLAAEYDVPIVAAAGNDGVSADFHPFFPAAIRHDYMISVGGANRNGGWAHNYGEHTVDLAAPSIQIFQARYFNQVGFGSGTSYAAPQVAGALGLIRAARPSRAILSARWQLQSQARPWHNLAHRNAQDGMLHLAEVLRPLIDDRPPYQVADLTVDQVGFNGVALSWTAVKDEGTGEIAAGYSLRVAEQPITAQNFSRLSAVPLRIPNLDSRGKIRIVVHHLNANSIYYASVRPHDRDGNLGQPSANVSFRTAKLPSPLLYDPCDQPGGPFRGDFGMRLAPGNPKTGILTYQDSPGQSYLPGTSASLTTRQPVDARSLLRPAIGFWHRRQFPNNERLDSLIVEAQRLGETTATKLGTLGGSSSPTLWTSFPIPSALAESGPLFLRLRMQTDLGPIVSTGIEIDDIMVYDATEVMEAPDYGELIIQPLDWLGGVSAEWKKTGTWTIRTDPILVPQVESQGSIAANWVQGEPLPRLTGEYWLSWPGIYEVFVAWPAVSSGPQILTMGPGSDFSQRLTPKVEDAHRWISLGQFPVGNAYRGGPWSFEIQPDPNGSFGTVVAPALRLKWISPLQTQNSADSTWLDVN